MFAPTTAPTVTPSKMPTFIPSILPTVVPTLKPTTFLPTIGPTTSTDFYQRGSNCVANATTCSVLCNGVRLPVRSVLTSDGVIQRLFETTASAFRYQVTVPLCGVPPTGNGPLTGLPISSFAATSIWQTGYPSGGVDHKLGTLSSGGWQFGILDGHNTLRAQFTGGDYCNVLIATRETLVYLVCDPAYTANAPVYIINEYETCRCKLTYFIIACFLSLTSYFFDR